MTKKRAPNYVDISGFSLQVFDVMLDGIENGQRIKTAIKMSPFFQTTVLCIFNDTNIGPLC